MPRLALCSRRHSPCPWPPHPGRSCHRLATNWTAPAPTGEPPAVPGSLVTPGQSGPNGGNSEVLQLVTPEPVPAG